MIEHKRLQLRRDTSANWQTENPVLLEGEVGVDLTNNNIKIGDGSTAWNELDYVHSDIDLSNYYTKNETDDVIEGAKDALQANIDAKVDNDTYQAKISEMEGNIEGKADKVDTYTKEEVDHLIAGAGTGVTKEYVDGEISRVEGEIPSLEGYATEAWVEGKGYLTEHQDISNLATKEELPTKTSELTNDSGFLTEHQSLDDYYTKEEIDGKQQTIDNALATKADATETANRFNSVDEYLEQLHTEVEEKADAGSIPTKTSELENDSNFLTEHQPLKTINGETIIGEGDIEIQGGGGNNWYGTEEEFNALGEYDESGNTLYHIEGQIDYNTDIKNLPLIAKKVSQLPNDAHYIQDVKKINGISMRGVGDIDIMKIIDKYHWWGTQEEYDAIEEKDANVQYHIEGDVPTETSTLIFELEDGTTKTIEVYIK